MTINARAKGAAGEREFCQWLEKNLGLGYRPERNLEQVRNGGYDVKVGDFVFEVKRCQVISEKNWWVQVKTACEEINGAIPIVAYRQNRKKWNFLISAQNIGLDLGYIRLTEPIFLEWIKTVAP